MKRNVGSYDVAARFVGGCGLLALANHGYGALGWIGGVTVASACTGRCALLWLLRVDTTACDRRIARSAVALDEVGRNHAAGARVPAAHPRAHRLEDGPRAFVDRPIRPRRE